MFIHLSGSPALKRPSHTRTNSPNSIFAFIIRCKRNLRVPGACSTFFCCPDIDQIEATKLPLGSFNILRLRIFRLVLNFFLWIWKYGPWKFDIPAEVARHVIKSHPLASHYELQMGKREKNNIWIQLDSYDTYIFGDTPTFAHINYILNMKERLQSRFLDQKWSPLFGTFLKIHPFWLPY